jgi:hypothetical protein
MDALGLRNKTNKVMGLSRRHQRRERPKLEANASTSSNSTTGQDVPIPIMATSVIRAAAAAILTAPRHPRVD